MNLPQLAEHSADRLGERMVMDFEGERFTNIQLLDWARRLQGGFSNFGLGRGDVAVMCVVNHPLGYPVFQGIFRTGGTAVPVMFQLAAAELRFVLTDTPAVVRESRDPTVRGFLDRHPPETMDSAEKFRRFIDDLEV